MDGRVNTSSPQPPAIVVVQGPKEEKKVCAIKQASKRRPWKDGQQFHPWSKIKTQPFGTRVVATAYISCKQCKQQVLSCLIIRFAPASSLVLYIHIGVCFDRTKKKRSDHNSELLLALLHGRWRMCWSLVFLAPKCHVQFYPIHIDWEKLSEFQSLVS